MSWLRARMTLIAITCSSFALAQEDNVTKANALFDEAKELQKNHRIAEACDRFAESYRLAPRGGTLLNLGLCHEAQGKLLAARRELKDAVAIAKRDGRTDRETMATEHIASVEAHLSWIAIAAPSNVEDIRVDDAPIARSDWPAIAIEPGTHTVRASAPGFAPREIKVSIGENPEKKTVTVPDLVSLTQNPQNPPPKEHTDGAKPATKANPLSTVALVTGITGVAVSLILGAWAIERKITLGNHCDANKTCDADGLAAASTGLPVTIASTIAFGVGAIGFGAWIFIPSRVQSSSPQGYGVRIGGTF